MTESLAERLAAYRVSHPQKRSRAGGGDFAYTVSPDVDGAFTGVVVVLHGGGSTAEAAHAFSIALEREHQRVIAIDWPSSARKVEDVLKGIDVILDVEKIERATFLGFSMGGMLAQAYAWTRSARVERLVLYVSMGPSARYAKKFAKYRRVLSLIPGRWLIAASRRAVAKWASDASREDPEAAAFVAGHRRAMFDDGKVTKASLLSDADVLVDFFSSAPTSTPPISCPVLIIEAAKDRMVDDTERAALKALYAHADVVTLAETDHFAGVLAPESVMLPIARFLARR